MEMKKKKGRRRRRRRRERESEWRRQDMVFGMLNLKQRLQTLDSIYNT